MKLFIALFTAVLTFSLSAQEPVQVIWEADAKARVVAFSPDGSVMYTGGLETEAPYSYGNIRRWDVPNRILLNSQTGYHLGLTNDISVSPSGNLVASGHGSIYCVPPSGACLNVINGFFIHNSEASGNMFSVPGLDGIVTGVSFSSTGEYAAFGMRRTLSSQIKVYRTSDYQQTDSF